MRLPNFLLRVRPSRLAAAVLAVGCASTAFFCAPGGTPPGLPGVFIDTLKLILLDPGLGSPGASISWSLPANASISYLELYQSLRSDSMGTPFLTGIPISPASVKVAIPDSSPPFTIYFALRAVSVDPTGQKNFSDTLLLDSLIIGTPPQIYQPANGDSLSGRTMPVAVLIESDPGATLRQMWYEQDGSGWNASLDTCLPRNDCVTPLFGDNLVADTIILGPVSQPTPSLFCVLTEESIPTSRGFRQSLECSRFIRSE